MKSYLFVMRRPPNLGNHVQETLDMILTMAAFDQAVSVLFADDGVLQLKAGQNQAALSLKETSAIFNALPVYEVNSLYVEAESLKSRGLAPADLILPAQAIERIKISELMKRFQVIIPD
jgi:tRNA 2-thiouridine synthesizing protein C